jgi:hypothetical protein
MLGDDGSTHLYTRYAYTDMRSLYHTDIIGTIANGQ